MKNFVAPSPSKKNLRPHAPLTLRFSLRYRGRDLLTGGLRGKKRFALLLFFKKKNFEVKNEIS
jgi:hypothetical protein